MGSRAAFSRLFKRDLLPCSGVSCRFLPHLAGRGGKGVGQKGAVATRADGGVWKPLEIRLLAVSSLRRTLLAVAIQGHRVGHATLDDDDEVASTFLLCARIFSRAAAATEPPAQPSGYVPGWDRGGAAASLQAASVFRGPDRVCEVLVRVLVVIVRGLFVFSFYSLSLPVNWYPPLE
jgi:hypothetical protein